MSENEARKTKYEIMIDVMKALGVSSFDVKKVEKQLKKINAKPDSQGTYDEGYCKAVVDHFKLEKELEKSDKSMISSLKKQVKSLQKENKQLRDQVTELTDVKSLVNEVNDNLKKGFNSLYDQISESDEEPTYTDVSDVQMDNYSDEPTNTTVESSSQQ